KRISRAARWFDQRPHRRRIAAARKNHRRRAADHPARDERSHRTSVRTGARVMSSYSPALTWMHLFPAKVSWECDSAPEAIKQNFGAKVNASRRALAAWEH